VLPKLKGKGREKERERESLFGGGGDGSGDGNLLSGDGFVVRSGEALLLYTEHYSTLSFIPPTHHYPHSYYT
jgi:hypothetical protein